MNQRPSKDGKLSPPPSGWRKRNIQRCSRWMKAVAVNTKKLFHAARMEAIETGQMADTYWRRIKGKFGFIPTEKAPREDEIHAANEQLKDLPRFIPFFTVIFIPIPGITEAYIFAACAFERFTGNRIKLLPSQFSDLVKNPKQGQNNES